MVSATLTKVREIKHAADARPVVLLGWGVGAAIAAHVAGMERLAGLVRFCTRLRSVCLIILMSERYALDSRYPRWLD